MPCCSAAINANNERVPTLWARHDYEANVTDENGKSHYVNGTGYLMTYDPTTKAWSTSGCDCRKASISPGATMKWLMRSVSFSRPLKIVCPGAMGVPTGTGYQTFFVEVRAWL